MGYIYRLFSDVDSLTYVGSTTTSLETRLRGRRPWIG